jgi:hypothetical protein
MYSKGLKKRGLMKGEGLGVGKAREAAIEEVMSYPKALAYRWVGICFVQFSRITNHDTCWIYYTARRPEHQLDPRSSVQVCSSGITLDPILYEATSTPSLLLSNQALSALCAACA